MSDMLQQRCFNHGVREAVARCPECRRYFCRECITEHEDRVICAACLRKQARRPLLSRGGLTGAVWFSQLLLGVALTWFFFYLAGEALLALPSSFHEGTVWRVRWLDSQ